ncbi:hypothetical protein PVAND_017488 [Polypedilum vanderplanki]|uniref:Thioredoxin n=1 Tax=Polypedilum vanderplanki TaxID=319348 RepID=S6BTP4_POLVA|nr:hypothetical protein PVAND_017488 [Polypedilum vanderplanki]BAN67607.1 thioredoxin [Polypedilum vanderplanki]
MSNSNIFKVHDENEFDDRVLSSKDPILVGFYAPECEACDTIISRAEQIIEEKKGKMCLAEVNIAELSELSQKCGVVSGPVLAVAKEGSFHQRLSGLPEKKEICLFVEEGMKK